MDHHNMPESRDDALDVLTHLMRKMELKEFYQLLEEIHRHNRHGGKSADEAEHGLAGAGAAVAAGLLETAERVTVEGALWEQRNQTYTEFAAGEALELFWVIIAAMVPDAQTGDLTPEMSVGLTAQAEKAVALWIELNAPGAAAGMPGGETVEGEG